MKIKLDLINFLTICHILVVIINPVSLDFDLELTDQEFTPELNDETSLEYTSIVNDVTTSVSVSANLQY